MRLWSPKPRESWIRSGPLPKAPWAQPLLQSQFVTVVAQRAEQLAVGSRGGFRGFPAPEACFPVRKDKCTRIILWEDTARYSRHPEEASINHATHSASFSWNRGYCLFKENQITYFNYVSTANPLLSRTLINTTSDFIMSNWFQVQGQRVSLILNLEQKNKGVDIKCVQIYSLGYKSKAGGNLLIIDLHFQIGITQELKEMKSK